MYGTDGGLCVVLNQYTKESKKIILTKNNSYFTFTKKKYAKHVNQKSIIRKTSPN
jgi:hypothetical protein